MAVSARKIGAVLVGVLVGILLFALSMVALSEERPAKAQTTTQPGTLTTETLQGRTVSYTLNCNPQGTSTVNFTISGVAFGPYPGTFEERGTFTIGPQTEANVGQPFYLDVKFGTLLTFDSTFTIFSGATTITGTKELTSDREPPFDPQNEMLGLATCAQFRNQEIPSFLLVEASGQNMQFDAPLSYEARIDSPTGTHRETGLAEAIGQSVNAQGRRADTGQTIGIGLDSFVESFMTATREDREPATVELEPVAAVNPVSTSHTVTATVKNAAGQPLQGVKVEFRVEGAVTASGSCTTNAEGQCDFTFQGPDLPGATEIIAFADEDEDGQQDPGEPFGEATKVFVLPASTPGQVTGGGYILNAAGLEKIAFGFNAQSNANENPSSDVKGRCNVVDTTPDPEVVDGVLIGNNTHITCLDVQTLVQTPTHATFFGRAEVDGEQTTYRIDVDDLGEPGTGDTFKIQTDSGYVAGGPLTGGDIQIHKTEQR
jgi:hypothetical protein